MVKPSFASKSIGYGLEENGIIDPSQTAFLCRLQMLHGKHITAGAVIGKWQINRILIFFTFLLSPGAFIRLA
jgi:hypothetical protein